MVHSFRHLQLDIETIAECHHDSPELALKIAEDLSSRRYAFTNQISDLETALQERVEFLKRQAAEEKEAMEAEFMAKATAASGDDIDDSEENRRNEPVSVDREAFMRD